MVLREAVLDALEPLLEGALDDPGRFLSDPPNVELGDLAFGCFPLAKAWRRSPAQIATELAARVQPTDLIAGAEATGPYLNFRAHGSALLGRACAAVADGPLASCRVETPRRIMVEFSQPNTHKTFHVGHLRNVALGDALVRMLRTLGHDVVPANYYGDFGIDVAKCLWWLRTHPEETPPATGRTAWLGHAYIRANERIQADDGVLGEVRDVLRGMEAHGGEIWDQYQQTRQWCLDEFSDTYRWLGVRFEVDFYESEVEEPAHAIVDDNLARGVFTVSDGAVVCDLTPDLDTPALVRKRDGTSLYMTWDLALAKQKFDRHGIEQSLYVVGSEQKFHFEQLFLTLSRMGYARAADCRHVSYELVVLPEGKMSSRSGTAIPLHELREAVCEGIEARLDAVGARVQPEERDETVRRVAVACLKYGMLSVGTNKRVVFQLSDWTNPEGDTGAYLLYSLARIRSIFRRGGVEVDLRRPVEASAFGSAEERALLNHLLRLAPVVSRASEALDPSPIAGWCYECARAFSRFYKNCPVLKAEGTLRDARLLLVAATDAVLTEALELLGIEAVDAM